MLYIYIYIHIHAIYIYIYIYIYTHHNIQSVLIHLIYVSTYPPPRGTSRAYRQDFLSDPRMQQPTNPCLSRRGSGYNVIYEYIILYYTTLCYNGIHTEEPPS